MKLQKVSQTINPFAGISFAHEEFIKSGLLNLVDNHHAKKQVKCYSTFKTTTLPGDAFPHQRWIAILFF